MQYHENSLEFILDLQSGSVKQTNVEQHMFLSISQLSS